jgi:hypothetical protein
MRLSCSNNNQDVGVAKRNTIKTFTFDVTNDSDKIFTIEVVNGCGCTGSRLKDNPILPGETSQLEVNFDPNKNALGTWQKVVNLVYYDAELNENKLLPLYFTVTVEE